MIDSVSSWARHLALPLSQEEPGLWPHNPCCPAFLWLSIVDLCLFGFLSTGRHSANPVCGVCSPITEVQSVRFSILDSLKVGV